MNGNGDKLFCVMDFVPNKKGSLCKFLVRLVQSVTEKDPQIYFFFSGASVEWFVEEMKRYRVEFKVVEGSSVSLKNFIRVI
ncbi:MAG: hypothetical protein PHR77_01585 [Kiritimatiellae bacterium]|nr:hypothetical protein [Kiritimatiellia bacterium]MDD5521898.1 hypothetical protein [Kiritimatiellia bacterium]